MDDQSYVSLEQRLCLVCGISFDTGNLLLDKRLRASMKRHTTTGWGLCAEHQKLADDGFVALVECDPQRSGAPAAFLSMMVQRTKTMPCRVPFGSSLSAHLAR